MVLQPSFSYFHLWSLHQSGRDGSYDEFIGRIGIWPNTCHASCHTIHAARESAVVVKEPKLKVDLTRYVEDTGNVWSFDEAEIWLEKSESTLTFSLCGRKLIEVAWPTCMTPCWGWMICKVLRQDSPRNIIFSSTRLLMKMPLDTIDFQPLSLPLGITGIPFTAWKGNSWRHGAFWRWFWHPCSNTKKCIWESNISSPHPEATNESLYKSCVQPVIDAVLDLEILRTQDVA